MDSFGTMDDVFGQWIHSRMPVVLHVGVKYVICKVASSKTSPCFVGAGSHVLMYKKVDPHISLDIKGFEWDF